MPSPFDTVPLELFVIMIHMLLAACQDEQRRNQTIGILRLVTSRWRNVVDRDSSLWTTLKSSFPSPGVDFVLFRSRSSPLHIIYCSNDDPPHVGQNHHNHQPNQPAPDPFFAKVARHSRLWKTLKLHTHDHSITLLNYLRVPAPNLEELYIYGTGHQNLSDIFPSSPPSLKILVVRDYPISLSRLRLSQLEKIALFDVEFTVREIVHALSQTVCLRHLTLSHWIYNAPPALTSTTPSKIVTLAYLQELELNCGVAVTDDLLSSIVTPPLQRLVVYRDHDTAASLDLFMNWAAPTIRQSASRCLEFGDDDSSVYFRGPVTLVRGRWNDVDEISRTTDDMIAAALPEDFRTRIATVKWGYRNPTLAVARSISTLCPNVTSVYLPVVAHTFFNQFKIDPTFFPRLQHLQCPPPFDPRDIKQTNEWLDAVKQARSVRSMSISTIRIGRLPIRSLYGPSSIRLYPSEDSPLLYEEVPP